MQFQMKLVKTVCPSRKELYHTHTRARAAWIGEILVLLTPRALFEVAFDTIDFGRHCSYALPPDNVFSMNEFHCLFNH